MLPADFRAAVLVFLDQFIQRGAAEEIRELRARLATDHQLGELLNAQLPSGKPTAREGFDGMRAFLEIELARPTRLRTGKEGADLADLVSWTAWQPANEKGHFDTGGRLEMTSDPAQWHDWISSVQKAVSGR